MEDGKLGKYEVRGTLGKGAMGTVYEGWDPIIRRKVAIKTVRLPDISDADAQEELARFRIEAQAGGRLNHPNICGIFDYGETADFAYIVMEYIDGHTLKSSLDKEERFPIVETVRIMGELLAGLQFSHDRKVVHRDIKPANVMLTTDGQVKIADFGIARIESGNLTQAGAVLGTPAYMSPEQFMGAAIDARTDLYAAGVVLYQMLTGERPFEGGFSAIMHKALNTQPPRPSELSVMISPGFDEVVARAMAKRPDDRYQSAAEFSRALRAALEAPRTPPATVPWGDATINSTLETQIAATQIGGAAEARAAAADAGLMTLISAPATPPAGRDPGPGAAVMPPAGALPATARPPASGNRRPLFVGAGIVVLALAGAGGWFATRPGGAPAAVTTATLTAEPVKPAATSVASAPVTETPPAAANPPAPVQQTAGNSVAAIVAPVSPPPAPPVVQPVLAPIPPAPPPKPIEVPKAALASALAAVPCSMVGGSVMEPDETVLVNGLAHSGAPAAAIRRVLSETAPSASLDWQVTSFDGPYCRALDLMRPLATRFAAPPSGFVLALAGDRSRLQDGDLITLHLTTPDFPAYLQVDYLQHDGSVYHMHPTPTDPARLYPAGSRQSLGDPTAGGAQWAVSEPYGTEMISAIASSVPLFTHIRPDSETNDAYLRDLQTAIDAARKRGAKFAIGAVILDTEPKSR